VSSKVELWDHQREVIEFVKRQLQTNSLTSYALFWEMGTGKTRAAVQILRLVYRWILTASGLIKKKQDLLPQDIPLTLLVCPSSVFQHWQKEFRVGAGRLLSESLTILDQSSMQRRIDTTLRAKREGRRIFLVNTEALQQKKVWNRLAQAIGQPRVVLVDELHLFKSPTSKRGWALRRMGNGADFKLGLTGSPQLNGPEDYWGQMRFINKDVFPQQFDLWRQTNFIDKNERWKAKHNYFPKWVIRPECKERVAAAMAPYVDIRKKEDCLDLPPLVRQQILVPMSPAIRKAYHQMEKDLVADAEDGKAVVATVAVVKNLRLAEIANGKLEIGHSGKSEVQLLPCPKLDYLVEVIQNIYPAKIIVWNHWKALFPAIEEALFKAKPKISSVTIHGDTTSADRADRLKLFINEPSVQVMLASQAALGTGTDGLQVASYMAYYSKTNNLAHDSQSNDRAYRGGSEGHEKVTRYDFDMEGTIEEDITEALHNKLSDAELFKRMMKRMQEQERVAA
jgi:SNF2 family DNA or RNA helicase